MKNLAIENRVLQRDRVLQRRVLERYYYLESFYRIYLLMPVVTLLSFKMIGRLEVGKLGRGPQIL